jgi:hypothetical protein
MVDSSQGFRVSKASFNFIAVGWAALLAGVVGCGGSGSEATVEGMVTLDGAPVPAGSISFVPSAGGTQAYAMSDESGNYEAYTGRKPGLRPGEYKVTVVARQKPQVNQTEAGGPAAAGESITPRWYASPETTSLAISVEPGANDINLELSSQAPAGWRDPAKKR